MADAQCGELFAAAIEKWIVPITSAHLGQGRENGIEVSFAAMRSTTCRSGPCDNLCARMTILAVALNLKRPAGGGVRRRVFGYAAVIGRCWS